MRGSTTDHESSSATTDDAPWTESYEVGVPNRQRSPVDQADVEGFERLLVQSFANGGRAGPIDHVHTRRAIGA